MNNIWSASNSFKGLCLEDCSLFAGFCQEMANFNTCNWALGPGHLVYTSASLASRGEGEGGATRVSHGREWRSHRL